MKFSELKQKHDIENVNRKFYNSYNYNILKNLDFLGEKSQCVHTYLIRLIKLILRYMYLIRTYYMYLLHIRYMYLKYVRDTKTFKLKKIIA